MTAAMTPGPWEARTNDYGDVEVISIPKVVGDDVVCTVGRTAQGDKPAVASFGHFDTAEVRADAQAIAAVPAMVEALKPFVRFFKSEIHDLSPADDNTPVAAFRGENGEPLADIWIGDFRSAYEALKAAGIEL